MFQILHYKWAHPWAELNGAHQIESLSKLIDNIKPDNNCCEGGTSIEESTNSQTELYEVKVDCENSSTNNYSTDLNAKECPNS